MLPNGPAPAPRTSLALSHKPQSLMNYPNQMTAMAGRTPKLSTDAIGRRLMPNMQHYPQQGGQSPYDQAAGNEMLDVPNPFARPMSPFFGDAKNHPLASPVRRQPIQVPGGPR